MKKRVFLLGMAMLLLPLSILFSGCGQVDMLLSTLKNKTEELSTSREAKIYNEAVDEFFLALDNRDKDAIRNLFSPYIQKTDKDLEEQIDLLLEAYPGPTDFCGRDGKVVHGSYSNEYGSHSSMADSEFAVVSNGTYYWCYFQLMYENDFEEEQIGINRLTLCSAEYDCAIHYDEEGAEWPDTPGISVLMEYPLDSEVRAVCGSAYKYTQIERTLTEEQVKEFFRHSEQYSEFVEQFGEPNAKNVYYVYELPSEDSKPRYLRMGVNEQSDSISSASVVDDFVYMRTLWKKND